MKHLKQEMQLHLGIKGTSRKGLVLYEQGWVEACHKKCISVRSNRFRTTFLHRHATILDLSPSTARNIIRKSGEISVCKRQIQKLQQNACDLHTLRQHRIKMLL